MRSALGQAEYRRLTDETGLQELIARYPRRPGSRVLRALACVPQEPTRSDFEDLFIEFLVGEHLPGPVVNATIELRDRSIEPDFVWHDHKLIVELDSYAAHGTRHGFEEDRARDRAAQLERWRVLRITWRQYTAHRNELAAQLRRALA
jgi:very-short-patch-repair endonuclease